MYCWFPPPATPWSISMANLGSSRRDGVDLQFCIVKLLTQETTRNWRQRPTGNRLAGQPSASGTQNYFLDCGSTKHLDSSLQISVYLLEIILSQGFPGLRAKVADCLQK